MVIAYAFFVGNPEIRKTTFSSKQDPYDDLISRNSIDSGRRMSFAAVFSFS
jgi:hypothetical protein